MIDDEDRNKPFYRNKILSSLSNVTSGQRIKDRPFFKGWDIDFKYLKGDKHFDFQWNTDGNVYLIENNDRKKKEDGSVYCFFVDGIKDPDDFKYKLDRLIEEAK